MSLKTWRERLRRCFEDDYRAHTLHPLYWSERPHVDPTNELYRHAARRKTVTHFMANEEDITIDHDATVAEAHDGAWVQAWVYVNREDIKP